MALTLNGSANTIAGLAVGGLPDGIVDTDMIAANAVTAAKAAGRGLTEIDQWRLNASTTLGDGNDIITSNWERVDTAPNSGKLGTGMSQSSGVWTFPSTGWWHVTYEIQWFSTQDVRYAYAIVDNAAGTQLTEAQSSIAMNGSSWWGSFVSCQFIVDITDTSADSNKLRFRVNSESDLNLGNSSTDTRVNVSFLKLAET